MQPVTYLDGLVAARTDGSTAGIARIVIGIAALVQGGDTGHILGRVLDPARLQIPRFDWLPVISNDNLLFFIAAWFVAASAFTLGWRTRGSGSILALLMGYSLVLDEQAYSNHVYLLVLAVALLVMADCGNRFSLDAHQGRRRDTTPQWPLTLMKIQLSIVYLFAAVSKVNLLYISGAIIAANVQHGWLLPLPASLVRWEIMLPIAVASIGTEMFLAFAFWSKRYRGAAIYAGVLLHTMIVLAFPLRDGAPLVVFGVLMLGLYVPFFDSHAWLAQAYARLRREQATGQSMARSRTSG